MHCLYCTLVPHPPEQADSICPQLIRPCQASVSPCAQRTRCPRSGCAKGPAWPIRLHMGTVSSAQLSSRTPRQSREG